MPVRLSERAIADIADIWDRIAGISTESATRISDAVIDAALGLADFPERHAPLKDWERPVRQLTVGSWAVLYEIVGEPLHVTVLRIVSASADIPNIELPQPE